MNNQTPEIAYRMGYGAYNSNERCIPPLFSVLKKHRDSWISGWMDARNAAITTGETKWNYPPQ
jgi:ribosome modulation factor